MKYMQNMKFCIRNDTKNIPVYKVNFPLRADLLSSLKGIKEYFI